MTSTSATQGTPEFLVLPTMAEVPQADDGSPLIDGTAEVILVSVADDNGEDRLVALAFTSVPLLVEAMGEGQPWVIVPTREAEKALHGSGARAVLVDPRLADGTEEE
ncbi:SAV_915 family protein [Streptomyces sp. NPDC059582]|uniref:SAV_915 family protein n=1 Tax=Streptomyces sp. NPDC059582 TaxID=3346875 RepID=UPI00367531B0